MIKDQCSTLNQRHKLGHTVEWGLFFLLLMTLAARPFLVEMPYRTAIVAAGSMSAGQGAGSAMLQDREEFSRVTFAMLILGIGALWVVGGALAGGIKVRGGYLGALIAVFGALSLVSALCASDKRTALDCWIEQLSLLGAAFLAVQLCADKRRFMLLVILLGALAATMGAKAFWQRAVEIPSYIAEFSAHHKEDLATMGWAAGSPQAQLAEARLKDPAVHGFFALPNMFASVMIIFTLACGGLAFANLRDAVRRWRGNEDGQSGKGDRHRFQTTKSEPVPFSKSEPVPKRAGDIQIDLQAIAGLVSLVGAIGGAVALVMARSKGGDIAGALAVVAAAVVYFKRASLARHWKRWLLCVAAGFVLMGACVACYGIKHDSLPTKTMTFRWYYWTASAQIIRDNPLVGVGGGNFDTAYLQYRRAAAEESVKMPHNVLLHSLTQFGVPGGLCYIAIIATVLVGASRPRREPEGNIPLSGMPMVPGDRSAPNRRLMLAVVLLAPLAVLVTRWIFSVEAPDLPLLLAEAVGPAVILAGALALLGLAGPQAGVGLFPSQGAMGLGRCVGQRPTYLDLIRIAMACGCWGFFLHGLVEMSFWVPGAAMFFWVAAGACVAQGTGRESPKIWHPAIGWLAAVGAVVGICAAGWCLWLPCAKKDALGARLHEAVEARNATDAAWLCDEMAVADPLDPIPPAEAAKFVLRTCPPNGPATRVCLAQAVRYAQEAAKRGWHNAWYWQLAAQTKWLEADSDNFKYWNPPVVDADKDVRATQAWQANALANTYTAKGDYAAAVQALENAASLDQKSWMLHARLGDALWRQGKRDRARGQWGMAAGMVPSIALDSGSTELAQRAVSLDPMNSRVRLWAAQFFCDGREPEMCLRELEAARKIQAALLSPSVEAFNRSELEQVEILESRAACIGQ